MVDIVYLYNVIYGTINREIENFQHNYKKMDCYMYILSYTFSTGSYLKANLLRDDELKSWSKRFFLPVYYCMRMHKNVYRGSNF